MKGAQGERAEEYEDGMLLRRAADTYYWLKIIVLESLGAPASNLAHNAILLGHLVQDNKFLCFLTACLIIHAHVSEYY